MKRFFRILFWLCLAATVAAILPPVLFLVNVWRHDGRAALAAAAPGRNDASHLNDVVPGEVIPVARNLPEAEKQLVALVRRAVVEHRHIAISGAHHSMGGHALLPGQIVLDMLSFNAMELDRQNRVLTVGSGARWSEVIPFLDKEGFAVGVMQSNNDFSVGGSISVNCHGWQNDSPPIASTVLGLRLLLADGSIRTCSRTENPELFGLVLGGYGLFGIILDVKLRVVPNEYYVAEAHRVKPADYNLRYHELAGANPAIGMAYGRINIAPNGFFQEAIITVFKRRTTDRPVKDTVVEEKSDSLKRIVFRGEVGSGYGKNLRWWLENLVGEKGGELLARNRIMNEPSLWFANRDPDRTDILQEYFVPVARIGDFVEAARPILTRHQADLLNVTVRNVEKDSDSFLRYAREEVFGLVMLFNQKRTAPAEAEMRLLTQDLVDAVLACGGTYYLPYRAHPRREQFDRAYPQAREFFAKKRIYDPQEIFQNEFYLNYGTGIRD